LLTFNLCHNNVSDDDATSPRRRTFFKVSLILFSSFLQHLRRLGEHWWQKLNNFLLHVSDLRPLEKRVRDKLDHDKDAIQVPILPKVTNIGSQIYFFHIFVTLNRYCLVGQVFCNHFEPFFEEYL
jgi:hypothetical protein